MPVTHRLCNYKIEGFWSSSFLPENHPKINDFGFFRTSVQKSWFLENFSKHSKGNDDLGPLAPAATYDMFYGTPPNLCDKSFVKKTWLLNRAISPFLAQKCQKFPISKKNPKSPSFSQIWPKMLVFSENLRNGVGNRAVVVGSFDPIHEFAFTPYTDYQ